MRCVSNASPLIGLNQIARLDLIDALYSEVLVPAAVARETAGSVRLPPWIGVHSVPRNDVLTVDLSSLDAGEAEVIALALELGDAEVLIDERAGRRLAMRAGLRVTGTVGLLVEAKQEGLIERVRPLIDDLRTFGFFLSDALYEAVLLDTGEM
jgi:uncharacterized protein